MTSDTEGSCDGTLRVSRVIVLGSGSSASTPLLQCLLGRVGTPCAQCVEASLDVTSPNHRLNPSLLVQYRRESATNPATPEVFNLVIDCGKTFRETVLKVFTKFSINKIDALLLTHDHADAFLGLDDLREFSCSGSYARRMFVGPLPVYGSAATLRSCARVFPYLMPREPSPASDAMYVASLTFRELHAKTLDEYDRDDDVGTTSLFPVSSILMSDSVNRVDVIPIALEHGKGYLCLGYCIPLHARGEAGKWLVYMSDVSRVPTATRKYLLSLGTITILIVDMLSDGCAYPSHFNLDAAVDTIRELRPEQAYFVGISHHMNHSDLVKRCRDLDVRSAVAPATDGQVVFDCVRDAQ